MENLTENIFATGGQQVPANTSPVGSDNVTDNALAACGQPVLVVNSPADIYKYFPWILTYEETVQEDLNSKRLKFVRWNHAAPSSSSDSNDQPNNKYGNTGSSLHYKAESKHQFQHL